MPKLNRVKCFAVTLERTERCVVYVVATSKADIARTARKNDGAQEADSLLINDNVDFFDHEPVSVGFRTVDVVEQKEMPSGISDEYEAFTSLGAWEVWENMYREDDDEPSEQEKMLGDLLHGDLPLTAGFRNHIFETAK